MNYTGFLNVYKEKGMTSMSVCARIRRILHVDKVGHAGTLDPMAEGVLPVALGRACKSVEDAGREMKTYEAGMLLGTVTDTQDITGKILKQWDGRLPDDKQIEEAVNSFSGGYDQLTPMYSARQVDGRRLYDYARSGEDVERERKHIEISSIRITEINLPHVCFTVDCSKGTYVRTICNDIGEKLGCGACMESLKRTRVGKFYAETAIGFSEIEELERKGSVDSALRIITPTAAAIGKFDGTHVGHQLLLKELRKAAEENHLRSLVLIVEPDGKRIEEREERRNRLLSLGIDYVIELPLTKELMQTSAEDFLRKLLVERYSVKYLVGGKDISFGCNKKGNAEFLKLHAADYGIHFRLIDKLKLKGLKLKGMNLSVGTGTDEQEISSSLLRQSLEAGNMEDVRRLMGKNYEISGTVTHGRHLATEKLELATINLPVNEDRVLPPGGVYFSLVTVLGKEDRKFKNDLTAPKHTNFPTYPGISDLGHKPSINEGRDPLTLETHLFGEFSEDLYGKDVTVELLHYHRPEMKFNDLSELKCQILERDIPEAVSYFHRRFPQRSDAE